MEIYNLTSSWPCSGSSKTIESQGSFICRVTSIALGGIALLTGILFFKGIGELNVLGAVGGTALFAIGSLLLLRGLCVHRLKANKGDINPIQGKAPANPTLEDPPAKPNNPKNELEAILYMSISGNPAHLGHMAAMGTAIRELRNRNVTIKKAFVSLSAQAYVEEKQQRTIDKVCYSYQERIKFLLAVIAEAKKQNMFCSVEVKFWDDQKEGYSDHPISYEKLAREYPSNKIYLITGSDLCRSMNNWKSEKIAHAIIVTRGTGDKETIAERDSKDKITSLVSQSTGNKFVSTMHTEEKSRILLPNAFPEYEHFSSTAIRTKKICVTYTLPTIGDEVFGHQEQMSKEIAPENRETFPEISLNTQQLMEQGYYTNSKQERIPFRSAKELHDKTQIFRYFQQMEVAKKIHEQKTYVLERDCLDVAKEFVETGDKVAVVLFAGPEEVGGGFIDGSGAGQEERIIYRSDLAALMKYYHEEQTADPYGPRHFNETRFPLFTSLIHTPDVKIFRDSSFTVLDKPFQVGILISAAPVSNKYQKTINSFDLKFTETGPDYAKEETRLLMKRIIYTQLRGAYDCGYETLILGAFGCGAFQNPAGVVAEIYKEIIETYFECAFKRIVFAIIEGRSGESNPEGNVKPFRSCFPDSSDKKENLKF